MFYILYEFQLDKIAPLIHVNGTKERRIFADREHARIINKALTLIFIEKNLFAICLSYIEIDRDFMK